MTGAPASQSCRILDNSIVPSDPLQGRIGTILAAPGAGGSHAAERATPGIGRTSAPSNSGVGGAGAEQQGFEGIRTLLLHPAGPYREPRRAPIN